jgi:hypothetical protein
MYLWIAFYLIYIYLCIYVFYLFYFMYCEYVFYVFMFLIYFMYVQYLECLFILCIFMYLCIQVKANKVRHVRVNALYTCVSKAFMDLYLLSFLVDVFIVSYINY